MVINPVNATLTNGKSQQFSLTDSAGAPITIPSGGIAWRIDPSGLGSIDSDGMYRAPLQISALTTATIIGTLRVRVLKQPQPRPEYSLSR